MNSTRNDAGFLGGARKDAGCDRLCSRDVKGARGPCSRAAAFVSVLLLAYAGASHAALGGLPEQFNAEGAAVASTVSSTMSNYVVRDTTLTAGTQVREYIAANGIVFAVTWDGPVLPDLKALLGKYFDTMVAESKKMPRAGRSQIGVNLPEVVINSGGHMRAFEGSAWIPAQFPAGFSAADVR
jgi:hypothetical protein